MLFGKKEAQKIIEVLQKKVVLKKNRPFLAVVMVGENAASELYVKIKQKRAEEIGVGFKKNKLAADVSQEKIIQLIKKLNRQKKITGILLQLPLPKKFDEEKIIKMIDLKKDVDGLRYMVGSKFKPPTVMAVMHLIKMSQQKLINKKAVILCNSVEFGEEIKRFLISKKIKTDIKLKPKKDVDLHGYKVVVAAVGKKYFVKKEMIDKNCVLIDVGINQFKNKVYGDVHPDCLQKTKWLSAVPGGVGPLTVAYLFKNLVSF